MLQISSMSFKMLVIVPKEWRYRINVETGFREQFCSILRIPRTLLVLNVLLYFSWRRINFAKIGN